VRKGVREIERDRERERDFNFLLDLFLTKAIREHTEHKIERRDWIGPLV